MSIFHQKPTLSPDEILAKMNSIEGKFGQANYQEAFNDAQALEEAAPGYGAYHLGVAYHLGWGAPVDLDRAISYYRTATSTISNDFLGAAWYMGGLLYLHRKNDPTEASKWLQVAEKYNYPGSSLWLANCWFRLAMNLRSMAGQTLRMDEMSQAVTAATAYGIQARNKYLELMQQDPANVPYDHVVCLGRCSQMLYNQACRGEMSMGVSADTSAKSWVKHSIKAATGTMDHELQAKWLRDAALVCDAMDQAGHELIGEYFRAACGLLDAELHHSADAFYRVRWHMKRAGELGVGNASVFADVTTMLSDVTDSFDKMEERYGGIVITYMRGGHMPDLTPSYLPGKAPDPKSCKAFMDMVNTAMYAPAKPEPKAPEKKEKKGLFGFRKK